MVVTPVVRVLQRNHLTTPSPQADNRRRAMATRTVNEGRRAEGLPLLKKPKMHLPRSRASSSMEHIEVEQQNPTVLFADQECYWSVEIVEDEIPYLSKSPKTIVDQAHR